MKGHCSNPEETLTLVGFELRGEEQEDADNGSS